VVSQKKIGEWRKPMSKPDYICPQGSKAIIGGAVFHARLAFSLRNIDVNFVTPNHRLRPRWTRIHHICLGRHSTAATAMADPSTDSDKVCEALMHLDLLTSIRSATKGSQSCNNLNSNNLKMQPPQPRPLVRRNRRQRRPQDQSPLKSPCLKHLY
jgi:hypothetical protein